jgi:AcrR family transcriptional regulator
MARARNNEKHREMAAAALDVIADKGVAAFTLADIGHRAGINRTLLYWYFPNGVRDALGSAAALAAENASQSADQATFDVTHPVEQIDAWLVARAVHHATNPQQGAMLVAAGVTVAGRSHTLQRMVNGLRTGMSDGRVNSCDPEGVVNTCAVALDGAIASGANSGSLRAIDWLRTTVVAPLHTGDWSPQPLALPTEVTASADGIEDAATPAKKPLSQVVVAPTSLPRQMVRPSGSWLELD